jgi:hypothetical protein
MAVGNSHEISDYDPKTRGLSGRGKTRGEHDLPKAAGSPSHQPAVPTLVRSPNRRENREL